MLSTKFDEALLLYTLPSIMRKGLLDPGIGIVVYYGKNKKTGIPHKSVTPLEIETVQKLIRKESIEVTTTKGEVKILKSKSIKGFSFQSQTDFDFANRLKPIDNFKHPKGDGNVFGFAYNGYQYISKSVSDLKAHAIYYWYVGSLKKDIEKEKRFNCIFFEEGQCIRAKSFIPRKGYRDRPLEYVKSGTTVLWAGCERNVTLYLKNRSIEIDFKKDHFVKNIKANGKRLPGKLISDLSDLVKIEVQETKKKKKGGKK